MTSLDEATVFPADSHPLFQYINSYLLFIFIPLSALMGAKLTPSISSACSNSSVILGDNLLLNIDEKYNETVIEEFESENVLGIILAEDKIVKTYRDTNELFSDKTKIEIKNAKGKILGSGEVTGMAKKVEVQGKTIAVVLSDRIDFLTAKGNYMDSIFISSDYIDMKLFKNGTYACIQTNDEIAIYKIR